jgi:hypothetical protein
MQPKIEVSVLGIYIVVQLVLAGIEVTHVACSVLHRKVLAKPNIILFTAPKQRGARLLRKLPAKPNIGYFVVPNGNATFF